MGQSNKKPLAAPMKALLAAKLSFVQLKTAKESWLNKPDPTGESLLWRLTSLIWTTELTAKTASLIIKAWQYILARSQFEADTDTFEALNILYGAQDVICFSTTKFLVLQAVLCMCSHELSSDLLLISMTWSTEMTKHVILSSFGTLRSLALSCSKAQC